MVDTTLIKTIEGPDLIHKAGFEGSFFSKIARIKPLRARLLGGARGRTSGVTLVAGCVGGYALALPGRG